VVEAALLIAFLVYLRIEYDEIYVQGNQNNIYVRFFVFRAGAILFGLVFLALFTLSWLPMTDQGSCDQINASLGFTYALHKAPLYIFFLARVWIVRRPNDKSCDATTILCGLASCLMVVGLIANIIVYYNGVGDVESGYCSAIIDALGTQLTYVDIACDIIVCATLLGLFLKPIIEADHYRKTHESNNPTSGGTFRIDLNDIIKKNVKMGLAAMTSTAAAKITLAYFSVHIYMGLFFWLLTALEVGVNSFAILYTHQKFWNRLHKGDPSAVEQQGKVSEVAL
jgi:hypothetical protein